MWRTLLCAILFLVPPGIAPPEASSNSNVAIGSGARLEQLVEANIRAVHAYQILLARKNGQGGPGCYPRSAPPDDVLESLSTHQQSLLATPPDVLKSWVSGKPSVFDSSKDLQPLLNARLAMPENLPVNVFSAYLQIQAPKAPRVSIRSIANLYQLDLETERDGDRLQDLIGFYITLGLPIYVGQLGLPGTDQDFLIAGRALEGHSCASPVGLSVEEWQIAGRKIWNWGEKRLHIRDAQVVADELLKEPDVRALIPAMKSLPAQKIAIIGHSFTMDVHWASPSAFVPIVSAMFARENTRVQFHQFEAGGLTSSRAYKNFYRDALAEKPNIVFLVLINRTDEDIADLKTMGEGFRAAGIRVVMFDSVHDPSDSNTGKGKESLSVAGEAGIRIVPVSNILAAAPGRDQFLCLDHIHMKEPYHRLMAKEWLKVVLAMNDTNSSSR